MDASSSTAFSSQTSAPLSGTRTTRSFTASGRHLGFSTENVVSIAQKLLSALQAVNRSKYKKTVSIDTSEYENFISRAEQLVLLTSTLSAPSKVRDDALSLQISRLSSQVGEIHSHLGIPSLPPTASPQLPTSVLDGVRHSSLYLRDGNLVIAAPVTEGDGGTLLFRVHQSILSIQSPVFASMLTLPPPDANPDVYDGVPFVRLPDDSRDVESVLKVLYDPSELPHKRLDPKTPMRVRRVLAMATKYEMDSLRDRITAQIEADWPTSLAEWDRLETEIRGLEKEYESADDYMIDGLYLDDRLPEPIAAIRLARDFKIPKILPAAVYHLSRLTLDDDWFTLRREPDELQDRRTARWDLAQVDELKMMLKVGETIMDTGLPTLRGAKLCSSPEDCRRWRETSYVKWNMEKDILDVMRQFLEARPPHSLCKHCWKNASYSIEDRRNEVWDDIAEVIEKFDD